MIDADKYEGHLMDGDFQVWSWSSKMLKVANYEEQMATAALLRDTPLLLAEVIRLREALVGDSKDWNTDELVEKALTLHDKALAFDAIYDWHTRMQLQGEGIAHNLDRMDWLLKNPTKGYEDYDKEYDEE